MNDREKTNVNIPSSDFSVTFSGELDAISAEKIPEPGSCTILFCYFGEVRFSLGGRRYVLSRNAQAVLISDGSLKLSISDGLRAEAVIFKGELAVALFRYYLGEDDVAVIENSSPNLSKYSGITAYTALEAPQKGAPEISLFEAHRLLHGVFCKKELKSSHTSATAATIRRYIDTNTDQKLTLDELSRSFFISKTQIYRIFTKEYAISPMRYALSKKIETAKLMLTEGDAKISEIADALCFTDAKHFTKTFISFTGVRPSQYRKSRGNSPMIGEAEHTEDKELRRQ